MTSLYVCLFMNGCVKVGRSSNPKRRIEAHASRGECLGVDLMRHSVFMCAGSPIVSEAKLIERCQDAATAVRCREWFFGLSYEAVCSWAHEESLRLYVEQPTTSNEVADMLGSIQTATGWNQTEIGKRLGISQRHVGRLLVAHNDCSIKTYFAIRDLLGEVNQTPILPGAASHSMSGTAHMPNQ